MFLGAVFTTVYIWLVNNSSVLKQKHSQQLGIQTTGLPCADETTGVEPGSSNDSPSPTPTFATQPSSMDTTPHSSIKPKSLIGYVLFAWFFGGLGFHNFYALRTKSARTQLLMAVLSFGLLIPICWIWALVEICVVDRDGRGIPMQ